MSNQPHVPYPHTAVARAQEQINREAGQQGYSPPRTTTASDRLVGCGKTILVGAIGLISLPFLGFGCAYVANEYVFAPRDSTPPDPDFHVECINEEGKMSRIKYPWMLDANVNVPEKLDESVMPVGTRRADKCNVPTGTSQIYTSGDLVIEVRGRTLN